MTCPVAAEPEFVTGRLTACHGVRRSKITSSSEILTSHLQTQESLTKSVSQSLRIGLGQNIAAKVGGQVGVRHSSLFTHQGVDIKWLTVCHQCRTIAANFAGQSQVIGMTWSAKPGKPGIVGNINQRP